MKRRAKEKRLIPDTYIRRGLVLDDATSRSLTELGVALGDRVDFLPVNALYFNLLNLRRFDEFQRPIRDGLATHDSQLARVQRSLSSNQLDEKVTSLPLSRRSPLSVTDHGELCLNMSNGQEDHDEGDYSVDFIRWQAARAIEGALNCCLTMNQVMPNGDDDQIMIGTIKQANYPYDFTDYRALVDNPTLFAFIESAEVTFPEGIALGGVVATTQQRINARYPSPIW